MEPKTQKAKGIYAINKHFTTLGFYGTQDEPTVLPLGYDLIKEESDIENLLHWKEGEKKFGRPCPIKPRHGFVDSIPVANKKEALALFRKAKKSDPLAEMILMPLIDAKLNAIWTPGLLAIGAGNDGATSGKGSIQISTNAKLPVTSSTVVDMSAVAKGDVPYFEFVRDAGTSYCVQLRGGPMVGDLGTDYIPKKMTVKKIVKAQGDLEEWETTAKNLKGQEGVVVWHPGGNMADHYAVHSVLNHVPISITVEPKVGGTLEKSKKIMSLDANEVLTGLSLGVEMDLPYKEAALLVLGAVHNMTAFGPRESRLLGVGLSLALRLGMAACFGEARHKTQKLIDRKQVYKKAWKDMGEAVKRFNEARTKFYEGGWKSNFGGPKWAACADATAELWNLVVKFVQSKSEQDLENACMQLNTVINLAHNGGWWFNKFINARWFDIAAKVSGAAPLIAAFHRVYEVMTAKAPIEGLIAKVASADTKKDLAGKKLNAGAKALPYKIQKEGEQWVLVGENDKEGFNHLRDLAYALNVKLGRTTQKSYVAATYAVITRIINKATKNQTEWIIPELNGKEVKKGDDYYVGMEKQTSNAHAHLAAKKAASVMAMPEKIIAAQCKLNGNSLHIQFKTKGGYLKKDIPFKQEWKRGLEMNKKQYGTKDSLAVTPTQYIPVAVSASAVHLLGGKVLVVLKDYELIS